MSVYLYLFHGRDSIDQDMNAWGCEGPAIGPLAYVHTTYAGEVKLRGARDVMERFFPNTEIHFHDGFGEHAIQLAGDCLPHDGKFYGDWSVCTAAALRPCGFQRVKPTCDACGSDNVTRDAVAVWDQDTQAWTLLSTYDCTTCQDCERESDDLIDWRSLDGGPASDPAHIAPTADLPIVAPHAACPGEMPCRA